MFAAGLKRVILTPGALLPVAVCTALIVAGLALLLYPSLTHAETERLLLWSAAVLVLVWVASRWMLGRRVAWLRAAMERAGQGQAGVRLEAMGEPAWDAIVEAFNATMTKLEHDRERLILHEAELKQRNASMSALREALDSHAIVSVAARNGDIVFVNDKFCGTSGYTAEELLGRNHRLLKSGAHDAAFYADLWKTITSGQAWHGVIENRRKDGGHYWVQSSILPVLDAQGVPRQYISIRTDISARERLRQGLEMLASAEHGEALFTCLVHGIGIGLDARRAGLSRLSADGTRFDVVACWDSGAPGALFSYPRAGAPCERVLATQGEYVVEADLRGRFPQALTLAPPEAESYRGLVVGDHGGRAIGVLWAISERRADADPGAAALLAVAAKRAAAELMRLRVEAEMREKDERLELVLRAGRVGFWDWNVSTGEVATNDVVHEFFGAVASGLHDIRAWFALVHPDDREAFLAASRACLDGRESSFLQVARWRTERGWVWIRTQSQVTERAAGGRALRMMGVHFDIDEQRRAEAELIESEARFRVLVENVAVGIYLCNPQGEIIYANPPAERLYGMTAREAVAATWMQGIHAEDVERVRASWRALVAGRRDAVEEHFRLHGGDGLRHVHGHIHPVRVAGRLMGFVGSIEDVTERHVAAQERDRLQSQLQQAQKMEALGQLTGGIAHDFNNILASILGYASLAHSRYAGDNTKLAEYLAAVITAGERARDLIAKMLAFSREAPRERGSSMDVAALVREVTTLLASVIPSTITIAVDVADGVPRVQLGATDLHQVLVNLAVNARDAMGESGRIDIAVAAVQRAREICSTCHELIDGDYVEIVCRDTGSGMDEALQKRVFEPFFTTKEIGKGTGMGLAVVHGIVHRAGGHILVDSTPGIGTVFHLLLPPAPLQSDDTPPASLDIVPNRGGARCGRILVVDDEPLIANYLRELLESQGHAVSLAHDGQAALALLRERAGDFDLVVTDQTMPKLSGIGLVKALREIRAELPAILCTGFSDTVDLRSARALGVRRFLHKPVDAATMLRVVAEVLQAARPAAEVLTNR